MNTISKLLIASAVVASFAAPAFATDYRSELQANTTTAPMQTNDWTKAYAMDNAAPANHSAASTSGFDQVNGGM